jgi:hypothetical protein
MLTLYLTKAAKTQYGSKTAFSKNDSAESSYLPEEN